MNEHDSERIAGLLETDGYVGTEDADAAEVVVFNTCAVREYTEVFASALPAHRGSRHHAWVSVSTGCDNRCTFCIVPLVRGPQRSRALGDVLAEVQGLARNGVVEVTLLGQNVNTYGRDLTVPDSSRRSRFAELLRAVNDVDGIRRIRFTSPHPHDFTPDVVD